MAVAEAPDSSDYTHVAAFDLYSGTVEAVVAAFYFGSDFVFESGSDSGLCSGSVVYIDDVAAAASVGVPDSRIAGSLGL